MSNSESSDGGGMSDHLKRYQNYVNSLKSGKSSGISAAFGRASDILPPEALEVKVPKAAKPEPAVTPANTTGSAAPAKPSPVTTLGKETASQQAETFNIADQILDNDVEELAFLRTTIEELVSNCAPALDDPIGTRVMTADGEHEVISVYLEDGKRMFLLSDLSMLSEQEFVAALVSDTQELAQGSQPSAQSPQTASLSFAAQTDFVKTAADSIEVLAPTGLLLWHVYYSFGEISLISMADGGLIKRAEGREEFVFSTLSQVDFDIKIYILSGLVVDPLTGNIYIEVNQGAYTAAFLNNGWSVHQYRHHAGPDSYFVIEPIRPDKPSTMIRVRALQLNMQNGEVSYEALDSSATTTLRCRAL